MRDYSVIAREYAESVLSGEMLACKYVKLACKRHLDDLKRQNQTKFPYRYDEDTAARVCMFVEALPHTKGRWASKKELLTLQPWQVFIACVIFGWLRKADGLRRFRIAYIEIPRKNGKSLFAAALGLYMLIADGEFGAEVYSGASTLDQSMQVFRPAWEIVDKTPHLRDYFGLDLGGTKKNPGNIYCLKQSARFEPLIGDPGDGASPSFAIVDEYHEHRSASLYETMETGMGAREQPLMLVITTAGTDISGPCYQMRGDVVRVLEGTIESPTTFGVIYTIDKKDEWTSDEALKKANPNFGVSVNADDLIEKRNDAIEKTHKQTSFKTKHLNLWLASRDAWMNMTWWNRLADPALCEDDFAGEECWLGLDLSTTTDVTSCPKLFRRIIDGKEHYYLFPRNWLPESMVYDPDARSYQAWVEEGHLLVSGESMIDHDTIETAILEDDERYQIVTVGYDPYGAAGIVGRLINRGINAVEVPQRTQYLSPAMKYLYGLVKDGRFHHTGCPAMNWMMSNVTVRPDPNDNIFPRKEKVENKIDGATATITALAVAMREPERKPEPRIRDL